MLTFSAAVAQRWQRGGRAVVEHTEGVGLATPDVVAQTESVDNEVAHHAMIDDVEAGGRRVSIAQARAAKAPKGAK
jgi:hypothetical protein